MQTSSSPDRGFGRCPSCGYAFRGRKSTPCEPLTSSSPETYTYRCYQCMKPTNYLFGDARCGECTRLTPEEVRGEATAAEDVQD
jgi:hypothetical protein